MAMRMFRAGSLGLRLRLPTAGTRSCLSTGVDNKAKTSISDIFNPTPEHKGLDPLAVHIYVSVY
jgi:hypothetical protein